MTCLSPFTSTSCHVPVVEPAAFSTCSGGGGLLVSIDRGWDFTVVTVCITEVCSQQSILRTQGLPILTCVTVNKLSGFSDPRFPYSG